MLQFINGMPEAYAQIHGNACQGEIYGNVYFFGAPDGTVIIAELYGLPDLCDQMRETFYGFHIHEGGTCTGDANDPFKDTKGHYNPKNMTHPNHAGDLPPLLSNKGMAWMAVYTDRFRPEEVVGRTIVIHEMADDFRTQPSGDSGAKIACGEIIS